MTTTVANAASQLETPAGDPALPSRRLLSLDALRGFDMFWIVGGEEVVHSLYKACPIWPFKILDQQMDHKPWIGVAFYDLIFPLFVFIVGVSLVFSLTRTIERFGKAIALRRIFVRSLAIYFFGLLVYGGISDGFGHVRWMGVLQRIAITYFFASLIFCALNPKGIAAACAFLLIGYWALVTFVPIRDFNLEKNHLAKLQLTPEAAETRAAFLATTNRVRGRFDDGLNLPQHLDFQYLPGFKWDGAYDPEGILSTLPAIATCLLGVFAGLLLKNPNVTDRAKVFYLAAAGLCGLMLGFIWGLQFPVIKKIWTSSYVLVAGGYACLILALFYQVIEIWQRRRWCLPFVWIGMNAITIYLIFNLFPLGPLAERIAGGPIEKSISPWGEFLLATVVVALMFGLVRFLYQRKIFLRF